MFLQYSILSVSTGLFLATSGTFVSTTEAWIVPPTTTKSKSTFPTTSSRLSLSASDFNVVLRPSYDNEDAFDNFKIGNARIHRYSNDDIKRSADTDSSAEYVMWYHGRSKDLHTENDKLPPLSTGRIGRAISKNGLIWEKMEIGSSSEDVQDVTLGLNQESWWGFDTAHVGLGNVLLPIQTPAVMMEGGVYIMYYMGGSHQETKLLDYMTDIDNLPDHLQEKTLIGMNMKIGVALSQDGITWGRVEGDDPTGAVIVPYCKNDPNNSQQHETNIPEELYCAWPEVVVNPKATNKEESFLMYYSTMLKDTKEKCIAWATSEDGFRWYKKGISLLPDTNDKESLDTNGCARCCVVKDAVYDETTQTWTEVPNSWKMYYEGVSSKDHKHRILMASSTDGKIWKKIGLALDVGTDGAWDSNGVGSPHCIRLDDGTSRMYYTGQGADGSTAIGVAKLAGAGCEWEREQATIVFADAAS